MKRHKKTDRIIKDKMENFSMDAPMHLFDGIVDALDTESGAIAKPEPKSGNGRYWLLALLLLTMVGGGIWYATNNNASTNSTTEELSVISPNNTAEKNEKSTENLFGKKSNTEGNATNVESKNTNSISLGKKTTTVETPQKDLNTNDLANNISTPITSKSSFSQKDLITENRKKLQTNNSTFANSSFSKTNQNTNIQQSSSNVSLTEKGGEIPTTSTTIRFENNFEESIDVKNNNTLTNDVLESKNKTTNTSKIIANRKIAKEEVLFLPTLKTTKTSFNEKNEVYQLDLDPKCGIKPDGSKIKFTTSVDLFFSPDYASKILEYKSDDFRDYAALRKNSESASYSFNTGMRVNFLTEFDWAIRTGLVYTQINEIFKTQHEETVITIDVTTGDTLGYTTGLRDVNIKNTYRMFDIPLLIGYESKMKKFKLNINAGVYINLSSEQKGALFSPLEDRVVYFTEGHPDNYDIFKNRIGWSAFVGLGFNFPLSKKLQLIVEPHARYYPKSFTLKNYILNQKYVSGGLMIGLRRDL